MDQKLKVINDCYQKVLGRMVDDDGLRAYTDVDLDVLEKILMDSEEYRYQMEKRASARKVPSVLPSALSVPAGLPSDPSALPSGLFDIVVARYDEDPSFLEYFAYYPCRVFLYNKGKTITVRFKAKNIIVVDIPNFSFEEYAYLTHICTNYYNMRPTVFMQCAMDHCPDIFEFLQDMEAFGPFESMSQGLGQKDFADKNFEKIPSAYGMWYLPNSLDFTSVKNVFKSLGDWSYDDDIDPISFIEQRYGVTVSFPFFAPGAQVYVHDSRVTQYDIETYEKLRKDIEILDAAGRQVSSRFQEFLERYFWSSVWNERSE